MKEEITNAQLFRFCAGETTVKENDRIAAWLDENPEEHQQRLNDVHSMYLVSILCDESEAKLPTRRSAWVHPSLACTGLIRLPAKRMRRAPSLSSAIQRLCTPA